MHEPPKILVVDDEPLNVDYLEQELQELGYQTVSARNGQEALEQVRTENPDLVLLDIMMPVMDGFAVLARLKADAATRECPVIVISAMHDLSSVVRGIGEGADDYLPKPFEPVLLEARIQSSLDKKRLRDLQRELFGKFATREVVDELMATGFTLGGKLVDATAMFADIRSFTTISEAQSPAETIALLNDYFGHVMEAIGSEGGIVNQIMGDGLMAIFGAPLPRADHRARAVRAALMMMERVQELNRAQEVAQRATIRIGIGIASGEMVAGYTGTELRATYTCIGDTVNIASRLESHTKIVGEPILIDANTRAGLPETIRVREHGAVRLTGKTQAIRFYSVLP